jgi:hypothetical protein
MFSISFHTSSIKGSCLKFPKRDIDRAWKDVDHKRFLPSFRVDLNFKNMEEMKPSRRNTIVSNPLQPGTNIV